jgi:hypothetical protein
MTDFSCSVRSFDSVKRTLSLDKPVAGSNLAKPSCSYFKKEENLGI